MVKWGGKENTRIFKCVCPASGIILLGKIRQELESTGYMVNQTRMWYSSHQMFRSNQYWLESENYMYKHLVDGSRFANRLGWHWVMGSQTGKIYGFSKFQVNKRAPKICKECELINNCPIENWPEIMSISSKDIKVDLDIEKNFGPKTVLTSDQKPDFVWINGNSTRICMLYYYYTIIFW